MKTLLTIVIVLAAAVTGFAQHGHPVADAAIAGEWQMTIDSPHGVLQSALKIKQDGAAFDGTCDIDGIGTFVVNGKLDKLAITMTMKAHGSDSAFTLIGNVDGTKMKGTMGPEARPWSAVKK